MDDLAWTEALRRAPAVVPADADRPAPLLFDARHAAIVDAAGWNARREELLAAWRAFLGEVPRARDVGEVTTRAVEVIDDGRIERRLVFYETEPGVEVEAYLLRPTARVSERSRAGVLVFHSTVDHTIRQPAGLEGAPEFHVGLQRARRGDVALCPRNFLWGSDGTRRLDAAVAEFQKRHPGVTGMAKMLADAQCAVDVLASQPDVDPARMGAFGHSLGAKEVLYLAAFDERIKAAVFSEGGIGIGYSNWEAPWYLGEAVKRPGFALDHAQVLALAAARAFLVVGGDSADGDRSWPYVERGLEVWGLVGARERLGFLNHRGGHALPGEALAVCHRWLDGFLG